MFAMEDRTLDHLSRFARILLSQGFAGRTGVHPGPADCQEIGPREGRYSSSGSTHGRRVMRSARRSFYGPTYCRMLSRLSIVGLAPVPHIAYGRPSLHSLPPMPYRQKNFTVTVTRRDSATPVVSTYRTKAEAMQAANGFRSTLFPREGGQVIVHDPDGKEVQTWIEHPMGAHFAHHGGFQI